MNAAFIAIGMEADVFVFDKSIDRLRELDIALNGRCSTVYSSTLAIEEMLPRADLVIGAVLVHGARAPRVITREQLDADEAAARCSSTSRSTRAAASRPPARRRTATRPTRSTASSTTASRTCRARCRSPRPTRSRTRRFPTCSRSPTTASRGAIARDPGLRLGVNVAGGRDHERRRRREPRHAADAARRGARRPRPAA